MRCLYLCHCRLLQPAPHIALWFSGQAAGVASLFQNQGAKDRVLPKLLSCGTTRLPPGFWGSTCIRLGIRLSLPLEGHPNSELFPWTYVPWWRAGGASPSLPSWGEERRGKSKPFYLADNSLLLECPYLKDSLKFLSSLGVLEVGMGQTPLNKPGRMF